MTASDLRGARAIQLAEHWNQTEADWELFLTQNPEGCFVAAVQDGPDSEFVVGTVTTIRYGSGVCWISLLLVHREYRGLGIAKRLMKSAISANEGACTSLRLDATPAGKPVYEALGFRSDYTLERWARGPVDSAGTFDSPELIKVDATRPADVLRRDLEVFGADRSAVIHHMLLGAPRGAWRSEGANGAISFVLGRPGEFNYHIGPIISSDPGDTASLIAAGVAAAGRGPVIVDLNPASGAGPRLEALGFRMQRPFTRMTRGATVSEHPEALVAAIGPEFG